MIRGVAVHPLIKGARANIQAETDGERILAKKQSSGRAARVRKVTCDECYFRRNLLCALDLAEPCATFRPNAAQLKPPPQLHFVFRQERRTRAAWAFPTAQEQAALHA